LSIQLIITAEHLCKYDIANYWADKAIQDKSSTDEVWKGSFGEGIFLLPYYLQAGKTSEGLIALNESIEELWTRMRADGLSQQFGTSGEFYNSKLIFHGLMPVSFYLFGRFCGMITDVDVKSAIEQIITCELPDHLKKSISLFCEMCELVFFREMSDEVLSNKAKDHKQTLPELTMIYHFASSFNEKLKIKERVKRQIGTAIYFRLYIDYGMNPAKLFLLPLFSSCWRQLFAKYKIHFTSPRMVQRLFVVKISWTNLTFS